ncbi:hypothetical protein IEQ34_014403 [Dendrobium chrysotoxum]|uniref:Aluminum-activated malate transporter 10 n=1 Tax=Dendrobium chrysotoxum TaxID=161865 RepID=A0AAV7GIY9_DENCH|nr:hypothetical protein IEQ34_014403 [Dendrobium chrysotoxum]
MAAASKDTAMPLPTASTMVAPEWRVTIMEEGSSVKMEHEFGPARRAYLAVRAKVSTIVKMLWRMGADDPRKVVHGFKVGFALAVVSLFYYLRPLYDGVGGAAMWAVMTVVVIFEYTVGGSLYKGLNRAAATLTGGGLAVGVHYIASLTDEAWELVILNSSVFILASVVTFSRFVPAIKRRFDYGATIFILTFSLVAVSGYRVDQLVNLAQQRLSTIAIGISICLMVCMLICPVWAGSDLHYLIIRNMDKLAESLEGCVEEYFSGKEAQKARGYKCVINSKSSEDSLANLAAWEPAHGPFGFRHPWSQYQQVGAAMRSCAYCIEALHSSSHSEIQAPELMKRHLSEACIKLSSKSSGALKELSACMACMQSSECLSDMVKEMKEAVEEVKSALKSLPTQYNNELGLEKDDDNMVMKRQSLMESMPLVTVVSLLMEISVKVEGVAEAVEKLGGLAEFKPSGSKF